MIASTILKKFNLFTGDSSELSDEDSLDLLNAKYRKVLSQRVWRFLMKAGTGTIVGDSIDLPEDFFFFPITMTADITDEGNEKIVYVGTNKSVYKIVNFEDRIKYINQDSYCYVDISTSKLVFTKTPQEIDVYFTYCYKPEDLTTSDAPVFDSMFHDLLYYAMVSDDMICQLFDKARSYSSMTEAKYQDILNDLITFDSQFYQQ